MASEGFKKMDRESSDSEEEGPVVVIESHTELGPNLEFNGEDEERKSPRRRCLLGLHDYSRRTSVPKLNPKSLCVRVFCGTWNVAGRLPEDPSVLAQWLRVEVGPGERPPDLFVIGFQELIELSAGNVVLDSLLDTTSRNNARKWHAYLGEYLNMFGAEFGLKYKFVTEARLMGTYSLVLATEEFEPHISGIQRAFVATGAVGRLGNKGAVCVRMRINDVLMCFVTCHLAAHTEHVASRNEEYRIISTRQLFVESETSAPADCRVPDSLRMGVLHNMVSVIGGALGDLAEATINPTHPSKISSFINGTLAPQDRQTTTGIMVASEVEETLTVFDHDIVIWAGDLNYRLDTSLTAAEVVTLVNNDDLGGLRACDQLALEMSRPSEDRAWKGFFEGGLSFKPTYKLIPGKTEYDMNPEKKVRTPAWCDRVLWWMAEDIVNLECFKLESYDSKGPAISDHLPVAAVFKFSFLASKA